MNEKIETPYFVHPTAVIDDGAVIGEGTKIWHFCHVSASARIGRNCVIGQGCFIAPNVVIGDGSKLQNGISVYDGVIIEEEVFCGPHMVFTNVANPRAFIERKTEFRKTVIGRGASIGAGAVIVCGNDVGRYAFVGAGAVITKNAAPFSMVFGNPAAWKGWVGKCGSRLEFDGDGAAKGEDGAIYLIRDGVVIPEDEA